jgi:hypothetical protein
MDFNTLECVIAAILASGPATHSEVTQTAFVRYRHALEWLRHNGGPLQSDIKRQQQT